jgi:DNA-binding NarL/FixJ family response regulator
MSGVRDGLRPDDPVLTVFQRLLRQEHHPAPRAAQVVAALYAGQTTRESVAQTLGVQCSTIHRYRKQIYRILGTYDQIGVIRATWPLFMQAEKILAGELAA